MLRSADIALLLYGLTVHWLRSPNARITDNSVLVFISFVFDLLIKYMLLLNILFFTCNHNRALLKAEVLICQT